MKSFIVLLAACCLASQTFAQIPPTLNLMPVPAELKIATGTFRFATDQTVSVLGKAENRIYSQATRFLRRLSDRVSLGERNAIWFVKQESVQPSDTNASAAFVFSCKRAGKVELGEDESYQLNITPTQVRLTAETDIGLLRGIETILQLVDADATGYYLPCVEVNDRPRFAWRGLMLDVSRHFIDASHIKRTLDAMAAVKLNVLHWHLSDDQGFRIESKVYPRLHQFGSDGKYFTQEQVRDVVAYADGLGIRVMPEFDMPGHATAWFVGHPEIASGTTGTYSMERMFGGKFIMDPTRDTTYRFLEKFIKEMAGLFPDKYFHIGGDEVNGKEWLANPRIVEFMKNNNFNTRGELQKYFNKRILPIVQKYGKSMVGWDEIFEPGLPKDIIIHTWQRKDTLYRTARAGHQAILSQGYYIDLIQPTTDHYLCDPLPSDSLLTTDEAKRILGGEATMWSEYNSPETVDSRIWPRTAAIAERFWSPRSVKDTLDMYRRLDNISLRLEELGSTHERNYEMLLRRIVQSNDDRDVQPLKTLVDVIEPVKIYRRGRYGYSTLMYFSDVIDAARPDTKPAREFRAAVQNLLVQPNSTTALYPTLRTALSVWSGNHAQLLPIIQKTPRLKQIEPMSKLLADVATIGLTALDYMRPQDSVVAEQPSKKQKTLSKKAQAKADKEAAERLAAAQQSRADWYAAAKPVLAEAKKPFAKCELQVVTAIEQLVNAATQATISILPTIPLSIPQKK